MQGKRLSLNAQEPLGISSAVSIEYEDALFLGEVVSCLDASGNWNVEVKIEQILTGLHSLMALREGLLAEGVPQPLTLMPIGVLN